MQIAQVEKPIMEDMLTIEEWMIQLYSDKWNNILHYLAKKYRGLDRYEDIVEETRDKIVESWIYKRDQDPEWYENKHTKGYIYTLLKWRLRDSHQKYYPKPKPPDSLIKEYGELGKKIFNMRLSGNNPEQTYKRLSIKLPEGLNISANDIEKIYKICDQYKSSNGELVDLDGLKEHEKPFINPHFEDNNDAGDARILLLGIAYPEYFDVYEMEQFIATLDTLKKSLPNRLHLTDEEGMILQLLLRGHTYESAGEILGIAKHRVRYIAKHGENQDDVLYKIKKYLEQAGMPNDGLKNIHKYKDLRELTDLIKTVNCDNRLIHEGERRYEGDN